MADYKCSKCDLTAHSKCVIQRTIFTADERSDVLCQTLGYKVVRNKTTRQAHIQLARSIVTAYIDTDDFRVEKYKPMIGAINQLMALELDDDQLMWNTIKMLRRMDESVLKHWVCRHNWVMLSEQCDLGCHHRDLGEKA